MVNIEIRFRYLGAPDESAVSGGVNRLLGSWIQNGQVLDGDWPVTFGPAECQVVVGCPELTALEHRHGNKYVRQSLFELAAQGLEQPVFRVLGEALNSPPADRCQRPSWYILITSVFWVESPLQCGDHYLPVPLYRIPPTDETASNYYDIHCWQRLWRDCDDIYFQSGPGERFATRQISNVDSTLSREGRDLCSNIERLTGVPTYYYLFRGEGRSLASERRRLCPSCGGQWLLPEPVHMYDFRCERCRLVSNIAFGSKPAAKA